VFFPYGDDQVHGGHRPVVTYTFLVLNALVFFWQLGDPDGNGYAMAYAAIPANVMAGEDWFTLLTSQFMHGGVMHLLGNMLFLWIFADNIEATIGSPTFLLFYLLGGIAASIGHIAVDPLSPIPMLGASGAISAVLGAYVVLFPKSRIKAFFLFIPVRIPALFFLGFWFITQLSKGMQTLTGIETGVAWWAHIGGFAFGIAGGFWMRQRFMPATLRT